MHECTRSRTGRAPCYMCHMPCPFEEFAEENGSTSWRARWLMDRLGYVTWASFRKVINKATSSCILANCDILENFRSTKNIVEGHEEEDFKLSRFACFLVAQHADGRKPEVIEVRTYLAGLAVVLVDTQMLDRLEERGRLSDGETGMTAAAFKAGVSGEDMALFKDAGFRGLYNMSRRRIAEHKGLATNKNLYDYMGLEELAANSFRVTQTTARLKLSGVQGASMARRIAHDVGTDVRATMVNRPEDLVLEENIQEVRKAIKTTSKAFSKRDARKKPRKSLASPKF